MSTFQGLAVPIYSDTGIELISVSSTGGITFNEEVTLAGGVAITAATTSTSTLTFTLSSSAAKSIIINVTSTGALADTATNAAILVNASSKSVLNSVIAYSSGFDTEVGTCNSFALFHGSKAPTYLLSVGGSQVGLGAALTNGFFSTTVTWVSAPSTSIPMGGLKILAGTKAYWIPIIPDTGMA